MSDFSFAEHERAAVAAYLGCKNFFAELADVIRRILEESFSRREIKIHSVQARAKDPSSFGAKAALPCESDPTRPKYEKPLEQITDLAGVRVIAFFPETLEHIDKVIREQLRIVERSDKGEALIDEEKFGYQSIHYLVRLSEPRTRLPEYQVFKDSIAEIQVRTILQHAWAEIEHDIQYKSSAGIPTEIRRRFMSLAGLLEIADREFQAIQDADANLKNEARVKVEAGDLGDVEITADSVKAFLDRELGPDGRISSWSYDWTARLLKKLGFRNLGQVEKCIQGFDDDRTSRIVSGSRQGQTTRFEHMLIAGMGERFFERHLLAGNAWWPPSHLASALDTMRNAGVDVGKYDPLSDQNGNRELRRLLIVVIAHRQDDDARVLLVTNNNSAWRTAEEAAFLLPYIEDANFDDEACKAYLCDTLRLNPESMALKIDPDNFLSSKYNPRYKAPTEYNFRFAQLRFLQPVPQLQTAAPELAIDPHRFEWHGLEFLRAHVPTQELNADVTNEVVRRFGNHLERATLSMQDRVPSPVDTK